MLRSKPRAHRSLLLLVLVLLCGRGALAAEGEAERSKRDFWPSRARWKEATLGALRDPGTWAPAAGAGIIAVGGWDRKISNWAIEHTPVFGSQDRALRASDQLRSASDLAMIATALAVRNPEAPWKSRFERILVEEGGAVLSSTATLGIKRATNRERPDESDEESFPSGHSSRAFAYAAMSMRNLDATSLSLAPARWLKAGVFGLAAGTAWARVEGGVHFPTDVLVGEALGNCVGRIIHDAFLDRDGRYAVTLGMRTVRDASPMVVVRIRVP